MLDVVDDVFAIEKRDVLRASEIARARACSLPETKPVTVHHGDMNNIANPARDHIKVKSTVQ